MLDISSRYFNADSGKNLIWCAKHKVGGFNLIKESIRTQIVEMERSGIDVLYGVGEKRKKYKKEYFIENEKLLFYVIKSNDITHPTGHGFATSTKIDVYVKDKKHITKYNVKRSLEKSIKIMQLSYNDYSGDDYFEGCPCVDDEGIQSYVINVINGVSSIYENEKEKEKEIKEEKRKKTLVENTEKAIKAFYGKTYSE